MPRAVFAHLRRGPADAGLCVTVRRHGALMNWNLVERDWSKLKGRAKQRWGKLSEQQLTSIAGNRTHLLSRIRETYQLTAAESETQLADWQSSLSAGRPIT